MPGSLGYEDQDAKTFASWVWIFSLPFFFVLDSIILVAASDEII